MSTVATPVLLARHGETDDNAAARFQGVRNPPLNDRGREQATQLAAALLGAGEDLFAGGAARAGHDGVANTLPPVREIWASPYLRARQTAEIIGARLELPVRFDERLKESDVGDWSGLTYGEVEAAHPEAFQAWVRGDQDHRFPGGEALSDVTARVLDAIAEARTLAPTVLLVCHGGVIRAAIAAGGHPAREPGVAVNGEAVAV